MKPEIEIPVVVNRTIGAKLKDKGKSLPKIQRGPQVKHFCHHCGVQGQGLSSGSSQPTKPTGSIRPKA